MPHKKPLTAPAGARRTSLVQRVLLFVAALAPSLLIVAVALAQTAPAPSATSDAPASGSAAPLASASAAPAAPPAPPPSDDPVVVALRQTTEQIRQLLAGTLESGIDPATLFDIALDDEAAISLEARRLDLVLRGVLEEKQRSEDAEREKAEREKAEREKAQAPDAGSGDAGPQPAPKGKKPAVLPAADAGVESAPADAGAAKLLLPLVDLLAEKVDPIRWQAQLELDEQRLRFYRLSKPERAKVLADHAAKQDTLAVAEKDLDEAERKSQEAAAEQQKALESASKARSEALRMVGEERARLLGVAKTQADFEAALVRSRKEIALRAETTLTWQRRVREAIDEASKAPANTPAIDRVYDELRSELRAARERLSESLSPLGSDSAVPGPGEDQLASLPPEVDRKAATEKREEVTREATRLTDQEREVREEKARVDYEQVVALDKGRLGLYEFLSSDKRSAITGFGPAGVDQARAEVRQVSLVLRYHLHATTNWLGNLRSGGGARGQSALAATILALKWLLPIALFIWWRRRAKPLLTQWQVTLRNERRKAGIVAPTPAERGVVFFTRIRGPLEWLLLLMSVLWLLPIEASQTLEIQLIRTIVVWSLGGALVVATIDALAQESSSHARQSRLQTAHIRLRSLRLVGRVVVTVGLVLSLTDKLVGQGTIHSWVFSTCWFAAIPISLVLVSWWRAVIYERLELKRRKSRLDRWILSQKSGYGALIGAIVGGGHLLAVGTYRFARAWISTFEATRRVLAYLFRRDISKRSEELSKLELGRLPDKVYEALGPESPALEPVASVADQQMREVIKRVNAAGGGVYAVVGERGSGKSTLLARMKAECHDVMLISCPFGGVEELSEAVRKEAKIEAVSLEELVTQLDTSGRDAGLLLDDAHRLISPMMGGLKAFDKILDLARSRSEHCAWVFAFDEILWRFVQRARGSRPLFDEVIHLEPWREEGIARLLIDRSKQVKAQPKFDHLLEELPQDADEIDRQEALERTSTNYYRLVWDYSAGNPGVALHTWRRCLGLDPEGSYAVRGFHAPEVVELEELPDSAVFVLRAVLQLEHALLDDISKATMLPHRAIEDALRFGLARGYFERIGDRYRVTWAWYRPIHRFLQRRHLLFTGS